MSEQYAYPGYEQVFAQLERLKREGKGLDAERALGMLTIIELYASQAQALRGVVKEYYEWIQLLDRFGSHHRDLYYQLGVNASVLQARAKELLGE